MNTGDQMSITGMFEFVRKKELSEEERTTINYDVFRSVEVTEEGQEEAASAADENNANDATYAQSEDNQTKEGLKDTSSSQQQEEVVDNSPSPTVSSSETTSSSREGSPAPKPLDEK